MTLIKVIAVAASWSYNTFAKRVEKAGDKLTRSLTRLRRTGKHHYLKARNRLEFGPREGAVEVHHHFGKVLSLTFDDGPRERFTREISSFLNAEGIVGTFFAQGRRAIQYPEDIRRLDDDGHVIGNHSFSHPRLVNPSRAQLEDEILGTHAAISDALRDRYPGGYPHRWFRPPWGLPWTRGGDRASRVRVMEFLLEHRFSLGLWNVDSGDWTWPKPDSVIERCRRSIDAEQGGAILMHDSHEAVIPALQTLIPEWKQQDYRIVPLAQLEAFRWDVPLLTRVQKLALSGATSVAAGWQILEMLAVA